MPDRSKENLPCVIHVKHWFQLFLCLVLSWLLVLKYTAAPNPLMLDILTDVFAFMHPLGPLIFLLRNRLRCVRAGQKVKTICPHGSLRLRTFWCKVPCQFHGCHWHWQEWWEFPFDLWPKLFIILGLRRPHINSVKRGGSFWVSSELICSSTKSICYFIKYVCWQGVLIWDKLMTSPVHTCTHVHTKRERTWLKWLVCKKPTAIVLSKSNNSSYSSLEERANHGLPCA